MSLTDLFKSKADRLSGAIKSNDLAAVEKLMAVKSLWLVNTIADEECNKVISKEMARLFIDKLDNAVFVRWSDSRMKDIANAKQVVAETLLVKAFKIKRYDLVDTILEEKLKFNDGKAEEHFAVSIIEAQAPEADKIRWLKKVFAEGFDKIENPDFLPQLAVRKNFPEAVGLFAAIGFDLHKNSELLLRTAVKERLPEMCRYLINEQGAAPEAVLRSARELGLKEDEKFLLTITETLPPKPLPTTLESALAEVQALRATVREFCEKVDGMQTPEKTLDKPGLQRPKPSLDPSP